MNRSAHNNHLKGAAAAMTAMLAVGLVALAGAKPAEAACAEFPQGHGPIAFENDGDICVASVMHLANLTPDKAAYDDVDPASLTIHTGRCLAY